MTFDSTLGTTIMKYSLLIAAAALTLTACNNNSAEDAGADTAAADSAMAEQTDAVADASAESATANTAQGFVEQAAMSDMYEIEAGKLAQANGKSKEVKDFGAMMVAEHTKSSTELKAAAKSAEGVTAPAALDARKQADLDALKSAGDNFDATFKQQQVAAHTATLALLRSYADGGDNEALKAFAAKTAPVVEKHLEAARKLK